MNIFDAFKELDEGKAVKRKANEVVFFIVRSPAFNEQYIDRMFKEDFDKEYFRSYYHGATTFSRQDIETNDWEVYERPQRC